MYDTDLPTLYLYSSCDNVCSISFLRSDIQLFEPEQSEEEDEQIGDSDSGDSLDLDDILANTDLLIEQNESLSVQVDNLNNNLVTLHNDIKIGIGFGFVLMVYIMIKCAFGIFNKVFSSDKW